MNTTLPACWKPRLACTFCGSNFLFTEPDEYGSGGQWVSPIHVGCNDCKAEQVGDTEEEAVSRWNARATPPASAQDDAKDDITQRLRDNADLDAAEDGNPAVIRLEREAADEIDRLRRALATAPAAGDAREWEGLTKAELASYVGAIIDYGTDFVAPLYSVVESIEKRLREKNAASQQQEG